MSLQLYQVDQKNYLLDFKSLDIMCVCMFVCLSVCLSVYVCGLCVCVVGKDESTAVSSRSKELPAGLQEP